MEELLLEIIKPSKGFRKGLLMMGYERNSIHPDRFIVQDDNEREKTILKANCKVVVRRKVKRLKNTF